MKKKTVQWIAFVLSAYFFSTGIVVCQSISFDQTISVKEFIGQAVKEPSAPTVTEQAVDVASDKKEASNPAASSLESDQANAGDPTDFTKTIVKYYKDSDTCFGGKYPCFCRYTDKIDPPGYIEVCANLFEKGPAVVRVSYEYCKDIYDKLNNDRSGPVVSPVDPH